MNPTRAQTKKQIIEAEERAVWLAVATAVAGAIGVAESDVAIRWADRIADGFRSRYLDGRKTAPR